MESTFGISDVAIIFATLLGPIFALQVQRIIQAQQEKDQRRLTIFRTLMATRLANLSAAHVEALNAIPVEFFGKKSTFQGVVEAWRVYLNHLNRPGPVDEIWAEKRNDFFNDLLWKLSSAVRYDFTKLQIMKEVYSPVAHATLEAEQEVIRKGLSAIFRGEAALPLDIKSMPISAESAARQQQIQDLLLRWLDGAVKVELVEVSKQE